MSSSIAGEEEERFACSQWLYGDCRRVVGYSISADSSYFPFTLSWAQQHFVEFIILGVSPAAHHILDIRLGVGGIGIR